MLDSDAVATKTIFSSMGSPRTGMVLENLPAQKQGIWTSMSLTYQSLDMDLLGEEYDFEQGRSLLLSTGESGTQLKSVIHQHPKEGNECTGQDRGSEKCVTTATAFLYL